MNDEEKANQIILEIIEKQKEKKTIEEYIEALRTQVKVFMKATGKTYHEDMNGNIVTLRQQARETFDRDETLRLLGEVQFNECVKFKESNFEVLTVLSKESADAKKKFLEKKK